MSLAAVLLYYISYLFRKKAGKTENSDKTPLSVAYLATSLVTGYIAFCIFFKTLPGFSETIIKIPIIACGSLFAVISALTAGLVVMNYYGKIHFSKNEKGLYTFVRSNRKADEAMDNKLLFDGSGQDEKEKEAAAVYSGTYNEGEQDGTEPQYEAPRYRTLYDGTEPDSVQNNEALQDESAQNEPEFSQEIDPEKNSSVLKKYFPIIFFVSVTIIAMCIGYILGTKL